MNNKVLTSKEIEDTKYDIVFDNAYNDIMSTIKTNPNYTIENLQSFLQNLYVVEGNDWLGRGERQALVTSATIAACEVILYEWKKELEKKTKKF